MKIFNWKYKFFKKKIKQVECAIADLEFKLFKSREMREDIRKQRDRVVEALDAIDAKLPTDMAQEAKDALMAERKIQQTFKDNATEQLRMMDEEIDGRKATEDKPEYPGVIQQIDAMRELLQMYKDYINREL